MIGIYIELKELLTNIYKAKLYTNLVHNPFYSVSKEFIKCKLDVFASIEIYSNLWMGV